MPEAVRRLSPTQEDASHEPHPARDPRRVPEHADKIHALRQANAHFARLYDEYHEVNRSVHRAETDLEPRSDADVESLPQAADAASRTRFTPC